MKTINFIYKAARYRKFLSISLFFFSFPLFLIETIRPREDRAGNRRSIVDTSPIRGRKTHPRRAFSYTSMVIISHRWRVDFHCNIYRRIKDRLEIQVSLSLRLAHSRHSENREIWKQKYVPVRRGYNMDLHLK